MAIISLGRCLSDPNLFGRHFRGESWRAWKVFLAALFAELTDAAGLEIYRERTGRTTWPTAPFTEAAVIVGRRGGKSRILALDARLHVCRDPVRRAGVLAFGRDESQSALTLAGWLRAVLGEAAMATTMFQRSMRLSPRDPRVFITYTGLSCAHFAVRLRGSRDFAAREAR
jgi:hypothetical protein